MKRTTWSKRIGVFDWTVIAVTGALAVVTVYAASYPVVATDVFYLLIVAWALAAIGWSGRLMTSVQDPAARAAAAVLLVGSVVPVASIGVLLLFLWLAGSLGIALVTVAALGLFGVVIVRAEERRRAWLVAPTIVLLTLALLYTELPRLVRMSIAEPELTHYAQQVERGEPVAIPEYGDDAISIGTIPIYEVYRDDGHLRLVTGHVGILADDGAGLAYLPSGPPFADGRYEHLLGPWYRWYPY